MMVKGLSWSRVEWGGLLIALAMALAMALTGCGFQLRGGNLHELPPLRIVGGQTGGGIRLELDHLMVGVRDAPDQRPAQAVLRILQEKFERRPLSISTALTVQEYQLFYSVGFQLTDPAGQPLAPSQLLRATRDYSFANTGQVLGKGNEEELLRQDMVQDLARQLLAQVLVLLRPPNASGSPSPPTP